MLVLKFIIVTDIIFLFHTHIIILKIILKITGVTFISEIASDIAKDCGYQAVANQVQIFGKLSVLVISFPVFTELISSIGKLLS